MNADYAVSLRFKLQSPFGSIERTRFSMPVNAPTEAACVGLKLRLAHPASCGLMDYTRSSGSLLGHTVR